jgi:hypothetical protein
MSFQTSFIPSSKIVSNITNADPAVVTTSTAHGYETGYKVRFVFPLDVGMNQLDEKVAKITKIDDTNFSIDIDTSNFDVWSPVGTSQLPQVIPVGSFQDSVLEATDNAGNITPEM